jgi:uncharacterized protein YebE (UPF0316 family)
MRMRGAKCARQESPQTETDMAEVLNWLASHPYFWPVFIFCARVTDVSIGTMRTIFVVRGYRLLAACLGFFEVTIWVIAVSGVIGNLHRWQNIVAYGLGFATGNAVGMWIEQTLAIGMQAIRFISHSRSAAVAEALRFAGFGVTVVPGHGRAGDVSVSYVVATRREAPLVIRVAEQIDPEVFTTVQDIRSTSFRDYRGMPVTGWRAIMKKK